MRYRLLMVGLTLTLTLPLLRADEPNADKAAKSPARIGRLVNQLGADSFVEREQARKDLETIGAPALEALRKAMNRGDLETSRRAAELIRTIEERGLTAELLAPKKVHLKLQDVPVLQAVEKLAKLSGYVVRVDGDRTVLTGKTVTLDTGEVTFWEALDSLGARAGLVEKLTVAALPGDPNDTFTDRSYFGVTGGLIERARGKRPVRVPPPPLRVMPLPAKAKLDKEVIERLDKLLAEQEAANKPGPQKEAATPSPLVIPGVVILMPSPAVQQHVSYAGAVRVLLRQAQPARVKSPAGAKHHDLMLEASAEPRLLGFAPIGVPTITRAIDEHGQALTFVIDPPSDKPPTPVDPNIEAIRDWLDLGVPMNRPAPRGITVRLEHGPKPAKRLKELTGSLSAQVLMPDSTLAALDLKSVKKSVDLKGGGRLQLVKIDKGGDSHTVVYTLDGLPGAGGPTVVGFRGNRQIIVNGMPVPQLLDAKGNRLTLVSGPAINQEQGPDGQVIRVTSTVQFRSDPGQGEPARLVLTGTHAATVVVPFRFADVTLP